MHYIIQLQYTCTILLNYSSNAIYCKIATHLHYIVYLQYTCIILFSAPYRKIATTRLIEATISFDLLSLPWVKCYKYFTRTLGLKSILYHSPNKQGPGKPVHLHSITNYMNFTPFLIEPWMYWIPRLQWVSLVCQVSMQNFFHLNSCWKF